MEQLDYLGKNPLYTFLAKEDALGLIARVFSRVIVTVVLLYGSKS